MKLNSSGELMLAVEVEGDSLPRGWCALAYCKGSYDALEELELALPPGTSCSVSGDLGTFEAPRDPGEFDTRLYHSIRRHAFALYDAVIGPAAAGASDGQQNVTAQTGQAGHAAARQYGIGERLRRCRIRLRRVLFTYLDPEDAGMAGAVLLGEKGLTDPERKNIYRDSGIIHILAISGLHIGILGSGLYRLLARRYRIRLPGSTGDAGCLRFRILPQPAAGIVSALAMVLYGIMTGWPVSACRAVIMFILQRSAGLLRRTYDMPTAIGAAAILILVPEPYLLFDSGFILSFGAVSCLAVLSETVRSSLAKAVLFQLGMLPLLLRQNLFFPLAGILLYLLILPLTEMLLVSLLLLTGIGIAAMLPVPALSAAARMTGGWVGMVLDLIDRLAGTAAGRGFCALMPGRPGILRVVLYYALILTALTWYAQDTGTLRRRRQSPQGRTWAGAAAKAAAVTALYAAALGLLLVRAHTGLDICMLDVGQGDGILIRCGAANILVDGGSSTRQDLYGRQLFPCLACYGVSRLDMLLISHDDADHVNASYALLQDGRIRVDMLALPDIDAGGRGEWYEKLLAAAGEQGIPVVLLAEGDTADVGDLRIRVLSPVRHAVCENANEGSLTFLLSYGSFDALFTGDLEGAAEERLTSACAGRIDTLLSDGRLELLKTAHHGSAYSTSGAFLQVFRPELSIISCGVNNRYGHPHRETLERLKAAGSRILRTDEGGAVLIRYREGRGYTAGSFLDRRGLFAR